MADQVSIYNMVRTRLRETGVIASTADNSKIVELLNTNWDNAFREVLREDYWTFAKVRALLSADGVTPDFGWSRRFLRMPDDVRLIPPRQNGDPSGARISYALEGRYILTDEAAPLKVWYISSAVPVSDWDPMFVELIAIDLAMKCAGALTGKTTHVEILSSLRVGALERAQRINSLEQEPDYAEPDTLGPVRGLPV